MSAGYEKVAGSDWGGELCPQAEAIVRAFDNPDAGPIEQMDIAAARAKHALADYDLPLGADGLRVEDRSIQLPGRARRIRLYTPPAEGPLPILVFAHGGCWTFCSVDSHDRLCRFYAQQAGCVVVSVDYAMAPEHPFPAALDDFYDALIWCFDHAAAIQGDPQRVAVAGDSAGGNLCAAAAQRILAHPRHRLSLQVLIYPICDAARLSGGTMERYASGYFFTHEVLAWTASLYAQGRDRTDPGISPIYGKVDAGLAPALFVIAECDILRDQALDYAAALCAAGVTVDRYYYRGVPHAFMAMAGSLDLGLQALQDSALRLRQAFSI